MGGNCTLADDYTYFCQSWEAGLCFGDDCTGFFWNGWGVGCVQNLVGGGGGGGGGMEEGGRFVFWLMAVHQILAGTVVLPDCSCCSAETQH